MCDPIVGGILLGAGGLLSFGSKVASGYSEKKNLLAQAAAKAQYAQQYMYQAQGYKTQASGYMEQSAGAMAAAEGYKTQVAGYMDVASSYAYSAKAFETQALGYETQALASLDAAKAYRVESGAHLYAAEGYKAQGAAENAIYSAQAVISEENAKMAFQGAAFTRAQAEVDVYKQNTSAAYASGLATYAASSGNIDVGVGSVVDVQAGIAQTAEFNNKAIRLVAAEEAYKLRQEGVQFQRAAEIDRMRGQAAQLSAQYAAGGEQYAAIGSLYGALGQEWASQGSMLAAEGARYGAQGQLATMQGAVHQAEGAEWAAYGQTFVARGAEWAALGSQQALLGSLAGYQGAMMEAQAYTNASSQAVLGGWLGGIGSILGSGGAAAPYFKAKS